MTLDLRRSGLRAKDMESVAYMLADNPFGESKITSFNAPTDHDD